MNYDRHSNLAFENISTFPIKRSQTETHLQQGPPETSINRNIIIYNIFFMCNYIPENPLKQ